MDFDQVAAAWGRWAAVFQNGAHPVSERIMERARVKNGDTVLDLGTGFGEPAISAAKAAAPAGRVVGIDISPAMISLARERAHETGVANVEFVVADASAYMTDERFDAIISRFGLMFLPTLSASLVHYRGLLRDGGRIAAAVWGTPAEVPMISLPMAAGARRFGLPPPPLEGGPFALHDSAALREQFMAAGYDDVAIHDMTATFPFESPGQYFAYMTDVAPPVNALLKQLDAEQAEEFRRIVEREAAERFGGADGTMSIPNRVFVIGAAASG
jgi:SAM-dependent methyltransferase